MTKISWLGIDIWMLHCVGGSAVGLLATAHAWLFNLSPWLIKCVVPCNRKYDIVTLCDAHYQYTFQYRQCPDIITGIFVGILIQRGK